VKELATERTCGRKNLRPKEFVAKANRTTASARGNFDRRREVSIELDPSVRTQSSGATAREQESRPEET
jgi:hypothetical protein